MLTDFNTLPPCWRESLQGALPERLDAFLKAESTIYPPRAEIFTAFHLTPLSKTRVVILGQDPYHGEGQAHGLAFSVRPGVKLPPSLRNIYKELGKASTNGDLSDWAKQGVLLLNATLTVRPETPMSHQGKGWEEFTDAAVRALNDNREGLVFMLWGSHAQKKGAFIDRKKHLVLEAPHPSPLSAHRGFLGCGHFKKTNEYLSSPVNW